MTRPAPPSRHPRQQRQQPPMRPAPPTERWWPLLLRRPRWGQAWWRLLRSWPPRRRRARRARKGRWVEQHAARAGSGCLGAVLRKGHAPEQVPCVHVCTHTWQAAPRLLGSCTLPGRSERQQTCLRRAPPAPASLTVPRLHTHPLASRRRPLLRSQRQATSAPVPARPPQRRRSVWPWSRRRVTTSRRSGRPGLRRSERRSVSASVQVRCMAPAKPGRRHNPAACGSPLPLWVPRAHPWHAPAERAARAEQQRREEEARRVADEAAAAAAEARAEQARQAAEEEARRRAAQVRPGCWRGRALFVGREGPACRGGCLSFGGGGEGAGRA
jgi:hypothetical protein